MTLLNTKTHKRLMEQLRHICIEDWDPIGIKYYVEAYDEYDSYIPELCKMLVENKTEKDIFEYLLRIERDHMSLSPQLKTIHKVAQKIYNLIPKK